MAAITINNGTITATSPEGLQATMPISRLAELISPREVDTGLFTLPDGTKNLKSRHPYTVLIHETPPRVHSFKWIAKDSPRPFGPGTEYRIVRIALPYLITLAVFQWIRNQPTFTHHNECFFRNEPLGRPDQSQLMYPALLNCSRFDPPEGHSLAWICTQHLDPASLSHTSDPNQRMRAAFGELMRTLLDTGFNLSSEHHEGSSWYSETRKRRVDPRIMTIEAWEAATEKNPLFPLEVRWIETGMTVLQVVERIFSNVGAGQGSVTSAEDLARYIFNNPSS